MKRLKTALRITLNTLFVLYTVWHICFTYTVIYLARDLYNLSPLDQSLMESSMLVFGLFAVFMPSLTLIISLVCFGLRKKAFGITYLAVFLACICTGFIQALPNPPLWFTYLAFSIFLFDSLTYTALFLSVALIAIASLIILYVVVSHIVKHQKE